MAKAKTSKKQQSSLDDILKNMPVMKLKKGARVHDYSPSKELRNRKEVKEALFQCLDDGDTEAFKEILGGYVRAIGPDVIAERSALSRRTIYNSVAEKGNPTLETIAKIMKAG